MDELDPKPTEVETYRIGESLYGAPRAIAFHKLFRSERSQSSFHPARLDLTRFEPLSVFSLMLLSAMRLSVAKLRGALQS